MIVLFLSQNVSLLPRSNLFLAGEANFVQAMCRSLERSPQDTRDGFNLYSAHASSPWPGHLGATTFTLFGLYPSKFVKVCWICFSSWGSFISSMSNANPISTILACLFTVLFEFRGKRCVGKGAWWPRCHLVPPALCIILYGGRLNKLSQKFV